MGDGQHGTIFKFLSDGLLNELIGSVINGIIKTTLNFNQISMISHFHYTYLWSTLAVASSITRILF